MAIRFSLHGSIRNISQGIQRAKQAEELGFEGIFIADSQTTCLDPFQALAICATHTKRLRLATAVTNMVYRDPTVLAGSAATLNEISDGRAILGMGTGDGPVYSLGRKATPIAKFEQGLKTMRELLQGKAAEFPTGKVSLKIGKLPVPLYVSLEGRTLTSRHRTDCRRHDLCGQRRRSGPRYRACAPGQPRSPQFPLHSGNGAARRAGWSKKVHGGL